MLTKENVRYIDHRVNISEEQKEKLCLAIDNNEGATIRFKHVDLTGGDDLIYFTEQQFKKIAKAFDKGRGVTIDMSKDQVQQYEIIEEDDDDMFYNPLAGSPRLLSMSN